MGQIKVVITREFEFGVGTGIVSITGGFKRGMRVYVASSSYKIYGVKSACNPPQRSSQPTEYQEIPESLRERLEHEGYVGE